MGPGRPFRRPSRSIGRRRAEPLPICLFRPLITGRRQDFRQHREAISITRLNSQISGPESRRIVASDVVMTGKVGARRIYRREKIGPADEGK